jgi:type III secretion protein S
MSPAVATEQLSQTLTLVLYLSMPTIIVASLVGLIMSLLQALTQVQEQTLPFAVKLIAVSATLWGTASFTANEILLHMNMVLNRFPQWVH